MKKKGGKINKTDVSVAKNYLKKRRDWRIKYFSEYVFYFAELKAKRGITMTMAEWANKLDSFLQFNQYHLLDDAGKIKKDVAKKFAESEYQKFRIKQDKEFVSDFDKVVSGINKGEKLPPPSPLPPPAPRIDEPLSDFNHKLKKRD